jgi:hypothetical protein
VKNLKAFKGENTWKELSSKPEKIEKPIMEYMHYG